MLELVRHFLALESVGEKRAIKHDKSHFFLFSLLKTTTTEDVFRGGGQGRRPHAAGALTNREKTLRGDLIFAE